MSETSFKKHLEELKAVLNQLQGDIESGPDDVVEDWYQQTKEVIYDFEDEVDSNLYVRLGMDEDSIEDGEILSDEDVGDTEYFDNQETEDDEETVYDISEEFDADSADEEDSYLTAVTENEDTENTKTITINITLPK